MILSLIAAMDKNRAIGNENNLLWHLPADMAFFKKTTMGKPILVGRKTYESFGAKPLPGRKNIVISTDKNYSANGAELASSLEEALSFVRNEDEVMVIGGSEIYRQAISRADKMYITLVDGIFDADAYFPEWNPDEWKEVSREEHKADEKNKYGYCFRIYERI